jgi:hypothetical protein
VIDAMEYAAYVHDVQVRRVPLREGMRELRAALHVCAHAYVLLSMRCVRVFDCMCDRVCQCLCVVLLFSW